MFHQTRFFCFFVKHCVLTLWGTVVQEVICKIKELNWDFESCFPKEGILWGNLGVIFPDLGILTMESSVKPRPHPLCWAAGWWCHGACDFILFDFFWCRQLICSLDLLRPSKLSSCLISHSCHAVICPSFHLIFVFFLHLPGHGIKAPKRWSVHILA